MRRNRGLTLSEVITVLAIIVALAAILFAVSGPARESARQQSCIANLRSIQQALELYTADWPKPAFEYTQIASPCGTAAFDEYLGSRYVKICPTATPAMRERRPSTYIWLISGFCDTEPDPEALRQRNEQIERLRERFPLVVCPVHDIVDYVPREADLAPFTVLPFLLELRADGSITRGRSDSIPRLPRLP
jgi:prepilin-type N-terminal cleavage/methylation domain-containing protein